MAVFAQSCRQGPGHSKIPTHESYSGLKIAQVISSLWALIYRWWSLGSYSSQFGGWATAITKSFGERALAERKHPLREVFPDTSRNFLVSAKALAPAREMSERVCLRPVACAKKKKRGLQSFRIWTSKLGLFNTATRLRECIHHFYGKLVAPSKLKKGLMSLPKSIFKISK